ncbi:MAG: tetratricopeptide repeat protein [Fuerstiella sp.]|nr:tetratricopeptide repeat protein [Fuerstiella sp.]
MIRVHLFIGLLVCSAVTGCGSMRSWKLPNGRQTVGLSSTEADTQPQRGGHVSWFGRSKSEPVKDSLVLDESSLSAGFKKSRGGFTSKGLKNPESTNLAFARWKEDMSQYSEAKTRYQEVLTVNPDCLAARLGIARVERETGRFEQCCDILTAAQEQYPQDPTVMLELGRTYNEREKWDQSIQAFSKAVDLAPEDQTVRYELGLALASADRMEQALPHLKFAVGDSAAYYNIGFILHERGRSAEALSWLERTMDSHPDKRTRHKAGELLAELDATLDVGPAPDGEMDATTPVPGTKSFDTTEIRAASGPSVPYAGFPEANRQSVRVQPAVSTQSSPVSSMAGTLSGAAAAYHPSAGLNSPAYNVPPKAPTSPPQWSGPARMQPAGSKPDFHEFSQP